MKGKRVLLRAARSEELDILSALSNLEGMDRLPSVDNVCVAVNEDDQIIGFIRLQQDRTGIWYVNPVVVESGWRGNGVGRMLIEDAHDRVGELRLIARGAVVPFYLKLGFSEMNWDDVDLEAASEDCDNCPYRADCFPQPMRLP